MKVNVELSDCVGIICAGLAIRTIVSLHSYSGSGKPPMYGDFEAQRHWQEITFNLKPREWYINSTNNDLLYWGLDYPPLTAYHSYLMGLLGQHINESYVALGSSHGYESSDHKNFMRFTVLIADMVVYLPAVFVICRTIKYQSPNISLLMLLFSIVLYPGQILIDNGHFQYNNISLGLCLFAISALFNDNITLTAVLYTLSLNYKQMELYHAVPFFVYLLRVCFDEQSLQLQMKKFISIAITVLLIFAILWLPWLSSMESILSVLNRLFPISRGVFEDKVGNFWCALNSIVKLKQKLTNQQTAFMCLGTTVAMIVPINMQLFSVKRRQIFSYALTNTALAFYLFSFQVHEKSILLVALPAMCLFTLMPFEVFWFLQTTTFSMFPLLVKDGLTIPFFALLFIYQICIKSMFFKEFGIVKSQNLNCISTVSVISMWTIALISLFAPTPERYPYLWPLVICLYSFSHFVIFFLYMNICQASLYF